MGCCVSTNKSIPPQKPVHIPTSTTTHGGVSKSPPPSHPLVEVETVKEVLSETHTLPKPSPTQISNFPSKHESPFIKSAPLLQDKEHHIGVVRKPAFAADDLSEASEICSSLSESVSASTSVTEKRERNGDRRVAELRELRQRSPARLRNRPFSGELHREKTVGRSPGRRSEPSPGRGRPVPAPASGYGRRRESGESSWRRSISPATRAEPGLGRALSARKTGKSPGRVAPGSAEKIRKFDGGKESGDSKWPPTHANNESLENPLVSLECFIFL